MFKTCLSLFAAVALTTSMAFAGSPVWSGDYVEVRSNHILGGGCTYSAEAGDDANQAVAACGSVQVNWLACPSSL